MYRLGSLRYLNCALLYIDAHRVIFDLLQPQAHTVVLPIDSMTRCYSLLVLQYLLQRFTLIFTFISLITYHDNIPQTGQTHRSLAPITKLKGPDELIEWNQKWRGHPEIVDKYRNAHWRYAFAVKMDSGAYSVGEPLTQTCVSPTVDHWPLSTHVDWTRLRQDSPNAVQQPKKYVQYKATISAIYSALYRYTDRCSISIHKYLRDMVKRLLTHDLDR